MADMEFFTINKNPKSLVALKYWLKKHYYNTWTTGGEDKNGNPIIPLRWDSKPDSDWGKVGDVLGMIVVRDNVSIDDVVDVLRSGIKSFT